MIKKNTIITDWLDKYGDPQIEKKVMERLDKITKELIIDEAYKNYIEETNKWSDSGLHNISLDELKMIGTMTGAISNARIRQYTNEEFIDKCKTDTEFSKHWGLKIEERELSREERIDLYAKEYTTGVRNKYEPPFDDFIDAKLKTRNIPTKLVILTYNDETIQVYE
jgi:hypothetical protein